MRYHYIPGRIDSSIYAKIYICDHPVYSRCTLYRNGNVGLAVIQQRYDAKRKYTWLRPMNTSVTRMMKTTIWIDI